MATQRVESGNAAGNVYVEKLKMAGIQICPYKIKEDNWLDDHLQWPSVEFGDVFNFLINSSDEYTMSSLKSYKSLDAYQYFKEGLVQNVQIFKPTESTNTLFRAKMAPGGGAGETVNSWIAVEEMGTVLVGHCGCTHGFSQPCVHVATLLFKIEEVIRLRDLEKYRKILNFDSSKCRCDECQYYDNICEGIDEKELCKPISEIEFFKPKPKRSTENKKSKLQMKISEPTHAEKYNFLHQLYKACPDAVLFTSFPPGAFKNPDPDPNLKL